MRKRKNFERPEGFRSARLIVIAAEGRKTENIYFEAMKTSLCSSNVHVVVLQRDDNNSSPENVLAQIKDFMAEYNIEEDDQLWVVVDRDRWESKMLASVARDCSKNDNLFFCVSNPCFELWLLLHLEDADSYDEQTKKALMANKKNSKRGKTWLKKRIKDLNGEYNESDYDANDFLLTIDTAIKRAVKLDVVPSDRWPQSAGTRVYLLARSIMSDNS